MDFLFDKQGGGGFSLAEDEESEWLITGGRLGKIPIKNGIPRFVSSNSYAENFGIQWNEFRKVQLDSYTKIPLSERRIQRILGKHFFELENKLVLEAGCGAGRFTEVLSKKTNTLVSLDISNAVDAAYLNLNSQNPNVKFLQADILDLPLKRNFFDVAICVGVLQHTPNTLESMREIVACVKPGGWIFVDHYKLKSKNLYPPIGGFGNVFRLFVRRLEPSQALSVSRKWVEFFFPIHWRYKDSRILESLLFRISPVRFYYPWLGLDEKQDYFNWAVLDTYDGSADKFKRRRTKRKLLSEIESLGVVNIEVWEDGNGLEARFQKPQVLLAP